ncbi:MAG: hypothetical protein BIFFINMI_02943 [Phycisphaerae bacterium]|nr:hypothetical protein [Phycisphaerae bacterium]
MPHLDRETIWLFAGVLGALVLASAIGALLRWRFGRGRAAETLRNLNARIVSWWAMCAVFAVALLTGGVGSIVLFAIVSLLALREFITLTPTRRGDHRTLAWVFFVILPFQYWLLYDRWYGLFAIFIPVYAFLFIPIRSALAGQTEDFLERTAKIQWGLMVCVYCVSHAPALLMLKLRNYEGQNMKLLLFLVIVVQISDVLQYVWGKTLGRHAIAPHVSPSKTWEGFIGGVLGATGVGTAMWWATPFNVWQAAAISLLIALLGFAGGLVMSAIKRDRGVKDYGHLIGGHGGMMDRIDSLCFAAPIFFHVLRYYF